MRTPTVGVIGCGDIAQKSYLPSFAGELRRWGRLAAVCDVVASRAESCGKKYRVPAFTDAGTMLRRGDLDAVVVLTPLLTHPRFARQAIRAGLHVYTEKPLAATVREADALVRLARRRRVILASAPSASVTPLVREARRLLRAGAIGKPCLVRAHSSHGGPGGVWNTDYSWVYRKSMSGPIPPIYDMGIYGLSTLAALLGPVKRVSALAGLAISPRKIEVAARKPYWLRPTGLDNAFLLLDFGDARLAALDASYCLRESEGWPIEIFGSDGALSLSAWGNKLRVCSHTGRGGLPRGRWVVRNVPPGPVSGFVKGVAHFLECVAKRREPDNGGDFSRHLVDIMESAIRSASTGRAIPLRTSFNWRTMR